MRCSSWASRPEAPRLDPSEDGPLAWYCPARRGFFALEEAPVGDRWDRMMDAWDESREGSWEHGEGRCPKVPHDGEGYLHGEGDDAPYDVDGVLYCGRCHRFVGGAG